MSKSIAKSTLSAPVVQSRLEHHHNQQLRIKPISHKRSNSKSTPKSKRHSHPKELSLSTASTPIVIPRIGRGDDIDIDRDSSIEQNRYRLVENTQSNDEARTGKQSNLQRKSSNNRRRYQSDSNDEKPITILKRSQSITDLTKPSHPIRSYPDEDAVERQTKLEKPSTPPPYSSRLQSKERRRSDIQPAKTKRSQHRKDIKSANDVFSLLVNTMPQSQDKDTFTTNVNSTITTNLPPFNQNTRMSGTPVKDTDSYVFPPSTHNGRRRMSSTAIEIKQHVQQFSDSKSSSDLKSVRHNRPASTPAKQQLYAGPDFHNAPAPSQLPIPSFVSKSLGKERSLLEDNLFGVGNVGASNDASTANSSPSMFTTPPLTPPTPSFVLDRAYDDDLFIMDDVHVVNNTYDDAYIRQQQSIQLKMMLASSKEKQSIAHNAPATYQQSATMGAYNVPQKMATARPLHVYDDTQGMSLTEISESLRNLLKISGH
ncbi:7152_t:CDS:1 [Paraglomus occultum]|uniref:7152_t:CDS:1 n=1 Tax=Paraglomus occultum TaxID=144539 RepID=A0A9N8ZLC3_9GLOM|nr:7152_t:CDS:1 [Paraglomus occultum]